MLLKKGICAHVDAQSTSARPDAPRFARLSTPATCGRVRVAATIASSRRVRRRRSHCLGVTACDRDGAPLCGLQPPDDLRRAIRAAGDATRRHSRGRGGDATQRRFARPRRRRRDPSLPTRIVASTPSPVIARTNSLVATDGRTYGNALMTVGSRARRPARAPVHRCARIVAIAASVVIWRLIFAGQSGPPPPRSMSAACPRAARHRRSCYPSYDPRLGDL